MHFCNAALLYDESWKRTDHSGNATEVDSQGSNNNDEQQNRFNQGEIIRACQMHFLNTLRLEPYELCCIQPAYQVTTRLYMFVSERQTESLKRT